MNCVNVLCMKISKKRFLLTKYAKIDEFLYPLCYGRPCIWSLRCHSNRFDNPCHWGWIEYPCTQIKTSQILFIFGSLWSKSSLECSPRIIKIYINKVMIYLESKKKKLFCCYLIMENWLIVHAKNQFPSISWLHWENY